MHISEMPDAIILLIIFFLTFWVFVIPKSFKYYYALILLTGGVILSTFWCFKVFTGNIEMLEIRLDLELMQSSFILNIDKLSAFFILVVNLTVFTGLLYARGYLEPYYKTKNSLRFSIHYLSYLWLYFSMILVVMIRDGLSFLIMWEIMALSSFLLVIFDAEDRNVMKTGVNYLIQMHVGMFFILIAFLMVGNATGRMSFDMLGLYFSTRSNLLLFILFFTGFGIKAGFIPLHTWLPQAHPAAPSHVSGVMSGVMIKMGIYGIFRVLMSVQSDLFAIGIIILVISLISGILGVMMAIVQHDLKRLLAYHSIENIGIIGIGTGLGVIGLATANPALSLLGFSGGLLHVLNHSLFKSLLFYNAGSVYQATHTRNIEQLGGLMKKMPFTAVFFLIGSLAICGLPPFNGFISEYLIFLGMFKSLANANLYQSIVVMGSLVGLALIGGLAVFCFTKAFGIAFLGEPRSVNAANAIEVRKNMIYPQYIIIAFILLIGLASVYFVKPVFNLVSQAFNITDVLAVQSASVSNLTQISLIGGIFILTIVALLVYRYFHLKTKQIETGPTWGCGYTAATHKHQYTATSYADNFIHLANPLLRTKKVILNIKAEDIFPVKRNFEIKSYDFFKRYLVDMPINFLLELLKKIAVMQTGQIQHYILYLFIYMLILFMLSYLNLI
jgi:formate hydrogenlyase subunit 3/multisubunit Na+/H+ antiporter MnhD subunit